MSFVTKFARLNIKEFTILRIKKTRTYLQLWLHLTMWHNLGQFHQESTYLLIRRCVYAYQAFLFLHLIH